MNGGAIALVAGCGDRQECCETSFEDELRHEHELGCGSMKRRGGPRGRARGDAFARQSLTGAGAVGFWGKESSAPRRARTDERAVDRLRWRPGRGLGCSARTAILFFGTAREQWLWHPPKTAKSKFLVRSLQVSEHDASNKVQFRAAWTSRRIHEAGIRRPRCGRGGAWQMIRHWLFALVLAHGTHR